MSRQGEKGCLIWIVIFGFSFLINILKENLMVITYISLCIVSLVFLTLFLDFVHTIYLLNFDVSLKRILEYDIEKTEIKISNLKSKNYLDYDVDKVYQDFIYDINTIKKQ